jgi:hypothetical protein
MRILHCANILLESWFRNIGFNDLQIYDVAHVKKKSTIRSKGTLP